MGRKPSVKPDAVKEWTIDLVRYGKGYEERWVPKRTKPGLGLYCSWEEARSKAALANGGTGPSVGSRFANSIKHAERNRNWPAGWWRANAEAYNARHERVMK